MAGASLSARLGTVRGYVHHHDTRAAARDDVAARARGVVSVRPPDPLLRPRGCPHPGRAVVNEDFSDLLAELAAAGARFLVVGAHAMALHGVPRATGDLDVWIATDPGNVEKVWQALASFGAPVESMGVSPRDLETPGSVVQIGVPPRRIDLMTTLTGLDFESAWQHRVMARVGSYEIPFLGKTELIANKRATGRHKDLADLEILEP